MAGFTNRGKFLVLEYVFRALTIPTNFYLALVTNDTPPGADHNTLSELTEISAGNGYTSGGESLTPGGTDFDTSSEDDTNDLAYVQVKDVSWTAAGGPIPSSGNGARFAVLLTDEVTVGNRQIIAYFDLGSAISIASGQTLTLQDTQMNLNET